MPDVITRTGTTVSLGHSRCLCRGCDEVFSSVSSFDQHQVGGECHPPQTRKLAHGDDGVWHSMGADTPTPDVTGRYATSDREATPRAPGSTGGIW